MLACWSPPMVHPSCWKSSGQCTFIFQKRPMSIIRASRGNRRMPRFAGMLLCVTGKLSVCRNKLKNPLIPVLDRYIFFELITPMVLGTAVFSALGVSMGVGPELGELLGRAGLTWSTSLLAIRLVLYRVPAYVGFALPIASLLAPLLAFGRMEGDNEIVALKSCGVNAWRIVQPALLMFTGVTALHLFLTESAIPMANKKAQEVKTEIVYLHDTVTPQLQLKTVSGSFQPVIYLNYQNGNLRHLFYAHRYNGNELLDVTLIEMQSGDPELYSKEGRNGPRLGKVLTANSATWDARGKFWILKNGAEFVVETTKSSEEKTAEFLDERCTKMLHQLPAPPAEYTLRSVCQFNARYSDGLTSAPLELVKLQHGSNFDELTHTEVVRLQQLLKESRNVTESRKIEVKLQQRMALPFACIIFGALGSLISFNLPTEQKKVGFSWMLAIVFSYYMLNVFGSVLGQLNIVSSFLGAWIPNLVGVLAILILLRKADS